MWRFDRSSPRVLWAPALLWLACTAERGTIGARLVQTSERRLVVREVPEGLAAAQGGVEPGDEILLIDGEDPRAMSPAQIHERLGGGVGEPVKLTLIRDETVVRCTLRRTPARRGLR